MRIQPINDLFEIPRTKHFVQTRSYNEQAVIVRRYWRSEPREGILPMQERERDIISYSDAQREAGPREILSLPPINAGGLSGRLTPTQRLGPLPEDRLDPPTSGQQYGGYSPADLQGIPRDYYYEAVPSTLGAHPDVLSGPLTSNPKRAYRQRRKDPSCDACRERKVKVRGISFVFGCWLTLYSVMPQKQQAVRNALAATFGVNSPKTPTVGCHRSSEKSSRILQHRADFRRQVQDLERQLQEVKAQLERLRNSENNSEETSRFSTSYSDPELPDVSRSPRRMLKARPPHDLSIARAHLSDVGRGILKPLIVPSALEHSPRTSATPSVLPPPDIVQPCLESYFECVQRRVPVVHWPTFCRNIQKLYSQDDNAERDRELVALTCAVLGLGAFFSPDTRIRARSEKLMQSAASQIDTWTDNIGLDQCLATFLLSMYMAENNTKSTSWVWLGAAIRIAQDKGLHVQGGTWSPIEGELRKRIWWSLYVSDR